MLNVTPHLQTIHVLKATRMGTKKLTTLPGRQRDPIAQGKQQAGGSIENRHFKNNAGCQFCMRHALVEQYTRQQATGELWLALINVSEVPTIKQNAYFYRNKSVVCG